LAVASGGGRESRLRKKGGDEKLESAGMMRWLLTYADMITLLLALFIILFSISTVSQVKFQALVHDVSGGFNNDWAINNPPNGGTTGDQSGHSGEADLQKIQQKIKAYIKDNKLQSNVETRATQTGDRTLARSTQSAACEDAQRHSRRGKHRQRAHRHLDLSQQLGAFGRSRHRRRALSRRPRRRAPDAHLPRRLRRVPPLAPQ
jgi:flagellar motor protein MotB